METMMIGETVGHYKITDKLGSGGMGEVFLAEDTRLDRQVALKFLPSEMWNKKEAQQRLIREAKAASRLDHPNIVTIYGIEEHEGRPYITMSRVRGTTLTEYCEERPRTVDELIELSLQIADGLQHAHEAGVIHRDLKPSNIMVNDRGRVRILDFGIASLRGAAKLTQTGTTVGTLAYAAPELAMGKDAGAASDIYSLGVVIYQMLTGQLPFDADHEAALLYSILNEAPKPLNDFALSIPTALQQVVMRCLEKDPAKRYQSFGELTTELRRCGAGQPNQKAKETQSEKPSIAVIPFANLSADPENEYFSDGLSEELLNVLAKNPGLKVTGRTSCFAFKGKHEDLREIGHKLGVETLLEGSVRKAGNRVRITAQLVKVTDGFHLWSETYDRVLDDIFEVQDDIARSVSEAMHVALLGKKAKAAPGNAETYSLLLEANHFVGRNTEETIAKALELYQKAIDIDPNNARAWAGLSSAYGTMAGYGYGDTFTAFPKAKEAAKKALELDDTLAEAHDVMGWIYLSFEFEWEKAGRHFRKALSLAPGNSLVLFGAAMYEAVNGDMDEALRLAKESVTSDPLSPSAHMFRGRVQMAAGQWDDAHKSYDKALELSPGITSVHAAKSVVYLMQEQLDDAVAMAQKESSTGYRTCSLAALYHLQGDKEKSDEQLALLLEEGEQWGIQFAVAYAIRGESDKAFEWLERSVELHDAGVPLVKIQPMFRDLHGDPRWPQFLKRIGLG
jgi:serine/threonine protein kinase/Tfp pilus assembly protein PilF